MHYLFYTLKRKNKRLNIIALPKCSSSALVDLYNIIWQRVCKFRCNATITREYLMLLYHQVRGASNPNVVDKNIMFRYDYFVYFSSVSSVHYRYAPQITPQRMASKFKYSNIDDL